MSEATCQRLRGQYTFESRGETPTNITLSISSRNNVTATHLYSDGARVNTKLARLRLVSGDKKAKKGLRASNAGHICTGSGLTPATTAPGTGLTAATSAPGLGSPLPHLHRDWAHPCRICAGDWVHPCRICTGIGLTVAVLHAVRAALSRAAAAASLPRPAGAGKGRHDRKRLLREAQSAFDKQQAEMNRQPMPALALQRDSSSEPTTSEDEARPRACPAPPETLLEPCTRARAGTRNCSRAEGDA